MSLRTLLIKNARAVLTMHPTLGEMQDTDLRIEGNRIAAIGQGLSADGCDEVIDARHCLVMPGLVNTHHHMYQSLTRAVPAAQNASLFDWLKTLYPIWGRLTPDALYVATQIAMAELILSGCTTSSDHLYIYPNGCKLDDSIAAAQEIGMRFHASRGSMSVGESKGGLPPDRLVEEEASILKDSLRLIETFHDADPLAMTRIVLAPCSPFSVSRDLMKEAAIMARHHGVMLHTHLAENDSDIAYSREVFNMTPAEYAEDCGWLGHDVWHAHCVKLDDDGIHKFAHSHTGVAHCPCSNMRLGSGIAPIQKMREAGVHVGLGVDGSASNDSGNLLAEARQAMLLARVGFGVHSMNARQALEIATIGGAQVLGRNDVGQLAPGMAADIAIFALDGLDLAGAQQDPIAASIFCSPPRAKYTIINGKVVNREGQLTTVNLIDLVQRHNHHSMQMCNG